MIIAHGLSTTGMLLPVKVQIPMDRVTQIISNLYDKTRQSLFTLLATIYLRANTTHVFIFTTCFGCDAPSSGEAEYNTSNYK
jgi:hypothetical protein